MLGGVWAVYAGFGLTVGSTAAFLPAIRADLELTRSQMGVILGTWQFVYLAASIPAGKFIDRVGLRWSLALAAAVIAASAGLRAIAGGFWSLLFAVAIFGIGGPLISIGAPKMVADWFDDVSRRTAVGIYGTGPAIGSAVGLAASNGLVRPLFDGSWRASVMFYAGIALLTGIYWLLVSPPVSPKEQSSAQRLASWGLMQIPVVRLVLVVAIGAFFYSHSLSNWLVEILESAGWESSSAGYWASFPTLLGITGTLLLPRLAAPHRRIAILSGAMLVGAVGIPFVLSDSAVVLAVALTASAIARVAIMPICMLILMDHPEVGRDNMAGVGGLFFTAAEVGGVAGPSVTGVLADATDGFGAPVAVLSAVLFVLSAFTWFALGRSTRSYIASGDSSEVEPV